MRSTRAGALRPGHNTVDDCNHNQGRGYLVGEHWPEQITPAQINDGSCAEQVIAARKALLRALELDELI